ncbi:hypothetical protein PoB_003022000 [Plakobranchus ocellatus]|uniref:Uncharacterized protein n=1 Tax=Plakobranchus ocellatus TaxID=259542 RepID=A0AAV4A6C1_9GAST|nr:hypothetical protein PoB_003022000 [Plakobranchus ocellatus]
MGPRGGTLPPPSETSLHIGPMGRKDKTCPLAMREPCHWKPLRGIWKGVRTCVLGRLSDGGARGMAATGSTSCGPTVAQLGYADR